MQKFLLILLLPFCLACKDTRQEESDTSKGAKQEKVFDETKWKIKKDRDYPHRDNMLEDLIRNDSIRKFRKDEVLNLLGEPDRMDNNYLFYMITQKRIGFWPLHTKTLVIKLYEDSTINWMKIHE